MATDATGTPTAPDNIPTYNTAGDPPSGKGFNAAMALIQTALSKRLLGTLATTAGDLLYATGANAFTRLGIGSNGNVLTVAGGVPTWAAPSSGGWVPLADVTMGTPAAALDSGVFSTSGYNHLRIIAHLRDTGASTLFSSLAQFNADTSASYYFDEIGAQAGAVSGGSLTAGSSAMRFGYHPGSTASANVRGILVADVPFATTTGMYHAYTSQTFNGGALASASACVAQEAGLYGNAGGAISRIRLLANTTFDATSRLIVLGY